MQDDELDAWLGPAVDEVTAEQRAAIHRAADAIHARYPHEDFVGEREQALNAAVFVILGDETVEAIRDSWVAARRRERDAHAAVTGAIIATVQGGEAEAALASRLGIARGTVRQAMGKPRTRVSTDPVSGFPTVEVGGDPISREAAEALSDED